MPEVQQQAVTMKRTAFSRARHGAPVGCERGRNAPFLRACGQAALLLQLKIGESAGGPGSLTCSAASYALSLTFSSRIPVLTLPFPMKLGACCTRGREQHCKQQLLRLWKGAPREPTGSTSRGSLSVPPVGRGRAARRRRGGHVEVQHVVQVVDGRILGLLGLDVPACGWAQMLFALLL